MSHSAPFKIQLDEGQFCDGAAHAELYSKARAGPPDAVYEFIVDYMRKSVRVVAGYV
jgi:hypothetical protein